jgi:hypothetical protein
VLPEVNKVLGCAAEQGGLNQQAEWLKVLRKRARSGGGGKKTCSSRKMVPEKYSDRLGGWRVIESGLIADAEIRAYC